MLDVSPRAKGPGEAAVECGRDMQILEAALIPEGEARPYTEGKPAIIAPVLIGESWPKFRVPGDEKPLVVGTEREALVYKGTDHQPFFFVITSLIGSIVLGPPRVNVRIAGPDADGCSLAHRGCCGAQGDKKECLDGSVHAVLSATREAWHSGKVIGTKEAGEGLTG